jgi:hypothetical protein
MELSPFARLVAIGIWTQCDDHGIFEWKPFSMKINLLPVDGVDLELLDLVLGETGRSLSSTRKSKAASVGGLLRF